MRLHKLQGARTLTLRFRVEVERGQVNHEVHEVRAAEPGREPNCLLLGWEPNPPASQVFSQAVRSWGVWTMGGQIREYSAYC